MDAEIIKDKIGYRDANANTMQCNAMQCNAMQCDMAEFVCMADGHDERV
jgi:hypothetical protein